MEHYLKDSRNRSLTFDLLQQELIILVETPEMRKRTLNVFYSWLVVAMVYYGLSFNSKHLGGNRYVNTFVSGFVEVILGFFSGLTQILL